MTRGFNEGTPGVEVLDMHLNYPLVHESNRPCHFIHGFGDYLRLLDWTGRQLANGKRGRIPNSVAPILERLKLDRKTWRELVGTFGRRFFHVAGQPTTIDTTPSRVSQQRYDIPSQTRELFQDANSRPTASV